MKHIKTDTLINKFYISSFTGSSGICKYSKDFYDLVLKAKGYQFIDSIEPLSFILAKVSSKDHAHIELGIFQKKEIQIVKAMVNAKYTNIAVTLHDAPLFKYPYHDFKNYLLNKLSRFYDLYIDRFKTAGEVLQKIRTIYVLTHKGLTEITKKYKAVNAFYLPHIVNLDQLLKEPIDNNNFIYLGFIGRNKGIEYSLQLHQRLLEKYPAIQFYVVGRALGKQKKFYRYLQKKYTTNVHYLGYVPGEKLNDVFNKATFAMIFFKDYKFYTPFSGSLLQSLAKGRIVITNKANAVPELVTEGFNGFYIIEKIRDDVKKISSLIDKKEKLEAVQQQSYNHLLQHYSPVVVSKYLKEV